jgi:hypothetical protein
MVQLLYRLHPESMTVIHWCTTIAVTFTVSVASPQDITGSLHIFVCVREYVCGCVYICMCVLARLRVCEFLCINPRQCPYHCSGTGVGRLKWWWLTVNSPLLPPPCPPTHTNTQDPTRREHHRGVSCTHIHIHIHIHIQTYTYTHI